MSLSYIVTADKTINVIAEGKSYCVPSSHQQYDNIKDAIRNNDVKLFIRLADTVAGLKDFVSGEVTVEGSNVFYKGNPLNNSITDRIVSLMNDNMPFQPTIRFLENLMQNPSYHSVQMAYKFLEHEGLPLTEDGCFLGYKRVDANWKDFYTGTHDNSIGNTLEMERNMVDDNAAIDCSNGYHVGSLKYVLAFHAGEGHIILVKVNPKDIVAVPDHDSTKVRVCKYIVLSEYLEETVLPKPLYSSGGQEFVANIDDEYEEDDEDDDYDYENDDDEDDGEDGEDDRY